MNLMFQPLRNYADFHGRSRRSEYWLFYLFTFLLGVVLGLLIVLSGMTEEAGTWAQLILVVPLFIPSLAVAMRRLHDTERSGWWLLIGIIPVLGWLVLLVFLVLDGTPGRNKFGPDPKGRGASL